MNLTEGDGEIDVVQIFETQDRKPILDNPQSQYGMNNPSELNQNAAPIEDNFWSGIFLSTYGSGAPSVRSDSQLLVGVSGSAPNNSILLTDAVSPALNREPEAFGDCALVAASIPQSQISAPSNLLLQQSQFGNSISSNEYGRVPSITRHNINRTPIAVQALPAQTLTLVPQQRPRNSFSTLTLRGPSLASQTSAGSSVVDGFNTASTLIERQQQYSRAHLSTLQMPQMTSSLLPQHPPPSNWNHQDRSFLSSQAAQQIVGLPAQSQLPSAYRPSSAPITEHQHSRQQQSMNVRIPHGMSQSASMMQSPGQPSTHFQQNHIPQGSTQTGVAQTAIPGSSQRLMLSAQRATQMARQPPSVLVPLQATRASPSSSFPMNASGFRASVGDQRGNTGGTLQLQSATAGTNGLADLPGEQNWRPLGRMRGSLSGRTYSDALNQFIIQPTQPTQAARPPFIMTPPPPPPPLAYRPRCMLSWKTGILPKVLIWQIIPQQSQPVGLVAQVFYLSSLQVCTDVTLYIV